MPFQPFSVFIRGTLVVLLCGAIFLSPTTMGRAAEDPSTATDIKLRILNQPDFQDGVDISQAILKLEDLPEGFEQLSETELASMEDLAMGMLRGLGISSFSGMTNLAAFRYPDPVQLEVAICFLMTPLTSAQQKAFDSDIGNPEDMIAQMVTVAERMGISDVALLPGMEDIGDSSIGMTMVAVSGSVRLRLEIIVARRAEVIEEVVIGYLDGQQPLAGARDLMLILDGRIVTLLPEPVVAAYREPAPLVPVMTTYIPTPLEISTEPAVIGANLAFAAVALIIFAIASELLNRTLAENEDRLARLFRPARWIGRARLEAEDVLKARIKRASWLDALKVLGVIVFYGLVFSFLETDWNPFSLTGAFLFISMTTAFGLVGISDDFVQWLAARRWGTPTGLNLRPANLLLAAGSTAFSRLFGIVPGILLGTPEAFDVEKSALDKHKEGQLLRITVFCLAGLILLSWLPTVLTGLAQRGELNDTASLLLGGVQSLLLLVFAVAVQNLFLQMLGLPDSVGRRLMQRSRLLWVLAFLTITFLFYHTLLNPKGDVQKALSSTSVTAFFITIGAFLGFSVIVWLFFKLLNRGKPRPLVQAAGMEIQLQAGEAGVNQPSSVIASGMEPRVPRITPKPRTFGQKAGIALLFGGIPLVCLGLFVLGVILLYPKVIEGFNLPPEGTEIAVAAEPISEEESTVTQETVHSPKSTPVARASSTPRPSATPRPTATAIPTPTPLTEPAISANALCVGYSLDDVETCLDEAGWVSYASENWAEKISGLEFCANGRIWIHTTRGIAYSDGAEWTLATDEYYGEMACDQDGGLWINQYKKGFSHFAGSEWTFYAIEKLGKGDYSHLVYDMGVAPDSRLWVVTADSVAVFDGSEWTIYEEGQGFQKAYYFDSLAIDNLGTIWVSQSNGLLRFDGNSWKPFENDQLFQTNSLAIDKQGRLWVGTYADGVSMFDGNQWVTYNSQNSGLSSDYVETVATDAQGRVWVGTEWGLNVFDGQVWHVFHVHNSGLTNNEVTSVKVGGNGPGLPALIEKPTGSLSGRIVKGSAPVASAPIEICVEYIGFYYDGPTPCSDQPFSRSTTTDEQGNFTFEDLPAGNYVITVKSEGEWTQLTDSMGLGSEKVDVLPGEETDVGDLDITK